MTAMTDALGAARSRALRAAVAVAATLALALALGVATTTLAAEPAGAWAACHGTDSNSPHYHWSDQHYRSYTQVVDNGRIEEWWKVPHYSRIPVVGQESYLTTIYCTRS